MHEQCLCRGWCRVCRSARVARDGSHPALGASDSIPGGAVGLIIGRPYRALGNVDLPATVYIYATYT
jgi:hypothetical protein